jgi:guanosine-3',5'-bis(diphosphate) 3'-pyrophosphohydrolase
VGKSDTPTSVVELKEVEANFRSLIDSIQPKLDNEDYRQIRKAYDLAVDAHKFQRRKSGEPYIHHPIEVARICYNEIGLGPTAITSAILHDIVEDTEVTLEEILDFFGPKISKIVDGLTKLDGLYNVESPQAENYKKVLSTLVYDVRVVLIKMADRLHNLRTIGSMPRHKQLKIAAETSYIYAPLAHRLGLYNIKKEFHDIILSIKEPETYQEIAQQLNQTKLERDAYIDEFITPLRTKIAELNIPYRVLGRPKSISSIYNKIKNKKVTFEEIYDLFAVRIIVDVPENKEKSICWQVYSLITDVYTPIPERLKDWVTNPKSNGYESLHTTIVGPQGKFVEVQIRSERMDDIAERGFAAHWKYKGNTNKINVYDRWLDSIRELLDNTTDTLEFISDFKTNLFKEEVYVFTPNGDMKIFPKGATALDFAFDIHSDIGYHAVAIKVNNKLVPMGYKLNNGDKVSVTTSKSQKPNENWLKLVVTGKAKAKIRSAMKEERRKKGEIGMETLERKLKNMKVGFLENIDMLVKYFGYKSRPDLYYAISSDKVDLQRLKDFEIEGHKLIVKEKEEPKPKRTKELLEDSVKLPAHKKQSAQQAVYINGEPGSKFNYSFANCCNPVQGDDIFGFITTGSGLKIHRTNCTNATHLMANYGYRIVQTEWAGNEVSEFTAELRIVGIDTGPGIIQKIIYEISENLGINIRAFNISGEEGYFEGHINIFVKNKNQLAVSILRLKQIDGISSVTRVEK